MHNKQFIVYEEFFSRKGWMRMIANAEWVLMINQLSHARFMQYWQILYWFLTFCCYFNCLKALYSCTFDKNLKCKLQIAQNKRIHLHLDQPPHSHIGTTNFRKLDCFTIFEKEESCIASPVFRYWNSIVPSYINDMFKPSFNKHNTRSQMALDIPLQKTST